MKGLRCDCSLLNKAVCLEDLQGALRLLSQTSAPKSFQVIILSKV